MNLEQLTSTDPSTWVTSQVIVFDWYDGPRYGFCRLEHPDVEFVFYLLDEQVDENEDNDRLYRLCELPTGSITAALSVLSGLGVPAGPVWVPRWQFPDAATKEAVEGALTEIELSSKPSSIVIRSSDLLRFRGCWQLPPNGQSPDNNWFAALSIASSVT